VCLCKYHPFAASYYLIYNISTINIYNTSQIHVYKHTTHILHTYSNIPIRKFEASFCIISYDLFALIWIHISNLNDCCIHVLKLPDDGPYVTETCSEIKTHLLWQRLCNHFLHIVIHNRMHTMKTATTDVMSIL
jgi:hypothetical protein